MIFSSCIHCWGWVLPDAASRSEATSGKTQSPFVEVCEGLVKDAEVVSPVARAVEANAFPRDEWLCASGHVGQNDFAVADCTPLDLDDARAVG
jgi:hypothetical protein